MLWKDKSKYQSATYREYMRNYQKACHQKHKAERIAQIHERRGRLREFLKQLKEKLECSQCRENHPVTLHFHHLDPQAKDFNLAEAIEHGYSLERIQKEIEKCIVLCANCHAKLHYEEAKSKELLLQEGLIVMIKQIEQNLTFDDEEKKAEG